MAQSVSPIHFLLTFRNSFCHTAVVTTAHHWRGQSISGEQIGFIRQLIADHPELSRWKLSRQLCEAWHWKQANGALRDMLCRGLLLMLHRAGKIELPPVNRKVRNRLAERERPEPVIADTRPVHATYHECRASRLTC